MASELDVYFGAPQFLANVKALIHSNSCLRSENWDQSHRPIGKLYVNGKFIHPKEPLP